MGKTRPARELLILATLSSWTIGPRSALSRRRAISCRCGLCRLDQLHLDDAIDFLARYLAHKFAPDQSATVWPFPLPRQSAQHFDIEVRYVAEVFWRQHGVTVLER